MMRRWSLAVPVLGMLAACGGTATEPLLRVWQVDAHTRNDTGCAAAGAAVATPAFVEFQLSIVEAREVIELVDCTAPGACAASAGVSGRLYDDQLPTGRRAQFFTAFGDASRCALGGFRSDAVIGADGTLRIESRTYETRDLSGVLCEGRTAEQMFGSLTCRGLDVITAHAAP